MMPESFEKLLTRLAQDHSIYQSVEEAIRQGVILPVLAHLGWNRDDIREVVPEYHVESGRVDYCLKIGDKKTVFIEVKRTSEDLERHEKQILEYSFADGIEMAVLTNGLLWWLYLPLVRGSWQQRKFFTIDIKQQEPETAVRHFRDFLGRDSVATGAALNQAGSLQASREREQLIKQTIPRAWEHIFSEPDELLLELMADKVESMCGHRPEPQVLARYVHDAFAGQLQKPMHPPTLSKRASLPESVRGKPQTTPGSTISTKRTPRGRGVAVTISGRRFDAASVSDLYSQVLRFLYDKKHIEKLKQHLPYATSNKRYLISTEPFHPNGNEFRVPVEYQGYYMEAHKDYKNALNALGSLLRLVGLDLQYER